MVSPRAATQRLSLRRPMPRADAITFAEPNSTAVYASSDAMAPSRRVTTASARRRRRTTTRKPAAGAAQCNVCTLQARRKGGARTRHSASARRSGSGGRGTQRPSRQALARARRGRARGRARSVRRSRPRRRARLFLAPPTNNHGLQNRVNVLKEKCRRVESTCGCLLWLVYGGGRVHDFAVRLDMSMSGSMPGCWVIPREMAHSGSVTHLYTGWDGSFESHTKTSLIYSVLSRPLLCRSLRCCFPTNKLKGGSGTG